MFLSTPLQNFNCCMYLILSGCMLKAQLWKSWILYLTVQSLSGKMCSLLWELCNENIFYWVWNSFIFLFTICCEIHVWSFKLPMFLFFLRNFIKQKGYLLDSYIDFFFMIQKYSFTHQEMICFPCSAFDWYICFYMY